jgi:hypothetical protein
MSHEPDEGYGRLKLPYSRKSPVCILLGARTGLRNLRAERRSPRVSANATVWSPEPACPVLTSCVRWRA